MVKFGAVIVVLCLAVSFYGADALKCWACGSTKHRWCSIPESFNETMKASRAFTAECQDDQDENTVVACRVSEITENGRTTIRRDCFQQRTDGIPTTEECLHGVRGHEDPRLAPQGAGSAACSLCTGPDFCNGGDSTYTYSSNVGDAGGAGSILPKAAVLLTTAILAKILVL